MMFKDIYDLEDLENEGFSLLSVPQGKLIPIDLTEENANSIMEEIKAEWNEETFEIDC